MNFDVRHLFLGLAIGGFVQGVSALGFGALPGSATLGQPLDLRIPLRLEPGEDVAPECVSASVQFGETTQQRGTTTATLEPALPGARERILRVFTTTRIGEPVVTVDVTAGCASTINRRFTLFADPPLYAPPGGDVANALAVTAPPAPSKPTASAALSPPSTQATPPAPRRVAKRVPKRTTAAAAPAPSRVPATTTAPTAPRAPATPALPAAGDATSRLKLATLEEGARASAAAASGPSPELVAAEAAASAASAEAAAASARAAEVEASGVRLRAEIDKAERTIGELKTRLQQIEAARNDSVLVYGLGGLALLLVALLIWMWRQREQEREASAWLEQAAAAAHPRAGTSDGDAATAEAVAFAPQPSAPAPLLPNGGFDDTQAASRAGLMSRPGSLGPISGPVPLAQERREVSVEELIDLEQQAEFFIVLGQDEAAIDLLMGHLRSTSDTSPLPYLKLLEICKRRGDRKEYERLRDRFNSRFSARAPEWETDLQGGLTLEDYPAVVRRLQSLWFQPQRAMDVLQTTLLREPSDSDVQADSFDLPAYRELMLLYSVARDLSESGDEGVGAVDLLLPLDESETGAPAPVFERLIATTSLEAQPSVHKPLSVDLPLDDGGAEGSRS